MYTVRNPYSLRPNQTSASDVVKNQKRLANKRAAYPYGELPKSQLSPQHHSEGASKAAYSRSGLHNGVPTYGYKEPSTFDKPQGDCYSIGGTITEFSRIESHGILPRHSITAVTDRAPVYTGDNTHTVFSLQKEKVMETDTNVVLNRASSPYRQPFGERTPKIGQSPPIQPRLDQAHRSAEHTAGSSSREERQYRTSAYVKQDAPLTIYDESKLHFYSQKIRDYYQNKTGCSEEQDVFQLQRILMPESRAKANTELADKLEELALQLHGFKFAQECIYYR